MFNNKFQKKGPFVMIMMVKVMMMVMMKFSVVCLIDELVRWPCCVPKILLKFAASHTPCLYCKFEQISNIILVFLLLASSSQKDNTLRWQPCVMLIIVNLQLTELMQSGVRFPSWHLLSQSQHQKQLNNVHNLGNLRPSKVNYMFATRKQLHQRVT